jgi:hypothetical protein
VNDLLGRRLRLLKPLYVATATVALTCAVLTAAAGAAPVTPNSATDCLGSIKKDPAPTSDDPNLIDYTIYCHGDFTAYTLIAHRRLWDFDTIDDFSSDVSVTQTDGTPSATEAVSCAATLPGDGINCNAGAGGVISAYYQVQGSFDLTDPYCKNLPKGAKPGTLAEPQAFVEYVVTDATGAQDGPFRLSLNPACPRVPDRVPLPAKKKKKKAASHKATREWTAIR